MTEPDNSALTYFIRRIARLSRDVGVKRQEIANLKAEIAALRDRNDALRDDDPTDPCQVDQQEITQRE